VTGYAGAVYHDNLCYPGGQQWLMAGTEAETRFSSLRHRDTESNLDPTYFRMFSSDQGRWLRPDPKLGCGGNPQNHNRYAYVANGPASRVDPLGLFIVFDPAPTYGSGFPCDPSFDPFCPVFGPIVVIVIAGGAPAPTTAQPTGPLSCPSGFNATFSIGAFVECLATGPPSVFPWGCFVLPIATATCIASAYSCASSISNLVVSGGVSVTFTISSCAVALASCGITYAYISACATQATVCVPGP